MTTGIFFYRGKVVAAHREFGKVYEKVERIGLTLSSNTSFQEILLSSKLSFPFEKTLPSSDFTDRIYEEFKDMFLIG